MLLCLRRTGSEVGRRKRQARAWLQFTSRSRHCITIFCVVS